MPSPRWYVVTEHKTDAKLAADLHLVSVHSSQKEALEVVKKQVERLTQTTGFTVQGIEGCPDIFKVKTPKRIYTLKIVQPEYLLNKRVFVNSSLCSRLGYNTKQGALYLRFKQNTLWRYDCPVEVFYQLTSAKSIGQMYNAVLKGKYAGEQIDG